jgi:hypothetical protein
VFSDNDIALACGAEVPEVDDSGRCMCLEGWHEGVIRQAFVVLRRGEWFRMGLPHGWQGACGCDHCPPVAASAGAI